MTKLSPALFCRYSVNCLDAYKIMKSEKPRVTDFYPLNYFLLCRSIELSLKAILVRENFSDQELKKLGHSLINTTAVVMFIGEINLNKREKTIVRMLEDYYRLKLFEYPKIGLKTLPDLTDAEDLAEKLLTVAKESINYGHL